MKITTPTATLGIRGTSGLVEVPEGASATSKNNVNVKLYPDADGRVGRIEVNDRAGAQLGFLTQGVERLCDSPRRGRRALCRRADIDHAADDRARHGICAAGAFDANARPPRVRRAARLPPRQSRLRQSEPADAPARPVQAEQFARPARWSAAARTACRDRTGPGSNSRDCRTSGTAATGRAGPARPAAAAGFAAAGWTIAAAGPARSGNSAGPDRTATAAGSARPAGAAPAAEPAGTACYATGRIAVTTDRGSTTTRPARTAATSGSAATDWCAIANRTTRIAAARRANHEKPACRRSRDGRVCRQIQPDRRSRGCRNRRVSFPAGCRASSFRASRFPASDHQVSRFRDSRHCRRQAPDNSGKAAFPARPACNGRDSRAGPHCRRRGGPRHQLRPRQGTRSKGTCANSLKTMSGRANVSSRGHSARNNSLKRRNHFGGFVQTS